MTIGDAYKTCRYERKEVGGLHERGSCDCVARGHKVSQKWNSIQDMHTM